MEFYSKKPIRIDYYPKTKEDIDKPEVTEVEEYLDEEYSDEDVDFESADEKEPVEKEIVECDHCAKEDAEIIKKIIDGYIEGDTEIMKEVTGEAMAADMEKALGETVEDIIMECEED